MFLGFRHSALLPGKMGLPARETGRLPAAEYVHLGDGEVGHCYSGKEKARVVLRL
jgi:hypothetical protein